MRRRRSSARSRRQLARRPKKNLRMKAADADKKRKEQDVAMAAAMEKAKADAAAAAAKAVEEAKAAAEAQLAESRRLAVEKLERDMQRPTYEGKTEEANEKSTWRVHPRSRLSERWQGHAPPFFGQCDDGGGASRTGHDNGRRRIPRPESRLRRGDARYAERPRGW